jgi:hypothetical protein
MGLHDGPILLLIGPYMDGLGSAVTVVTTRTAIVAARNGDGGRSHRASKHNGKQYPRENLPKFRHVSVSLSNSPEDSIRQSDCRCFF